MMNKERRAGLVNRVRRDLANWDFHLAGAHDQKSHGSWATGSSDSGDVIDPISNFDGAFDPHNLMDKNPQIQEAGNLAFGEIGKIHGIESGHPTVISLIDDGEWLGEGAENLGAYMPPELDSDPEKSFERGRMVIRGEGSVGSIASTIVHEFGHHLSLAGPGGVEKFHDDWESDGALGSIREAIENSQTGRDLEKTLEVMKSKAAEAVNKGDFDGMKKLVEDQGYVKYLLQPAELFARAYYQYITIKARNRPMWDNMNELLNENQGISQWGPDEFAPIMSSMDMYLKERGLLR